MNNKLNTLMIILGFIILNTGGILAQDSTQAQKPGQHGPHFVDKNGDGYNDNAPDHDGDGIPNGIDPDYQRDQKLKAKKRNRFVDLDGDGIDDNLMRESQKTQKAERKGQQKEQAQQSGSLDDNKPGSGKNRQNKKGAGKNK
ncbi:MAG: hypothetical protein JXR46_03990 [Calditrichaceae bacterium]|nr:hypothetical protein [Calditrichaceae bacterium]MBN2708187.1 hypothetical protein [Calditrichaceae bacterium]RQV97378.1 MAG: hypothetical protein EH224_01515 [Calditrichota bacterium]